MNARGIFAAGIAMGAGLLYLLDPERGRRRRALLRDQVVHTGHELEDAARSGARRVRNRAVGLAHELRAGLTERAVDDRVVEERVRSAIGRAVSNPGAVEVRAESGRVTLSGPVLADEVKPLVRTVRSVRGVADVEERLDIAADPDRIPGLQGTRQS